MASGPGAALANAPVLSLRPTPRPNGAIAVPTAPSAERLIRAAELGAAKTGYVVVDTANGEVLETMNPLLGLPPASVAKSVTALYALGRLGSGYRFKTRLLATGSVQNGQLNGDLILVGGGDPMLTTDMLGDLARELKNKGIHTVNGQFRFYSGMLPYIRQIDQSQPEHLGYNPAISGLNLNFNRVHFEWKRAGGAYDVTMEARAERYRPHVRVSEMQIVDRSTPVYTYRERDGRDNWTVARAALGNGGSRWLPVRHPEVYAAEVFQTLARSHGIALSTPRQMNRRPNGTLIAERSSDPLITILQGMLKFSTNLTAEVVGLSASQAGGGGVNSLSASGARMADWAATNLNASRPRFVDHSGLGDRSRISARDMVRVLNSSGARAALHPVLKAFQFRDENNNRLSNQLIEVRAKTGTLNFVSGLAGYATLPNGRDVTFAIFSADLDRRASIARGDRERPQGARGWSRRARRLQQKLIERWGALYDA